ncbi:MAG: caspase family protein, partial [Planctomycetota bacterium]
MLMAPWNQKGLAQDTSNDKQDNRGISVIGKDGRTAVERGDFWLVVIGINNYINFPKLQTAVNDAQEVKKVLLERYGFFDTKRLVELYDADATAKRILAELRSLSGKIKPDDSLFIYYAGHGNLDEITKSGAWIPVDGAKNDPTTWLDNGVLKNHLTVDAIKARHLLLISDSCFAGDFFTRNVQAPNITDAYVRTAFSKTSREAITSGGLEPVADAGFENHSVFAHFLLKSLKENTESYLLPAAVHERVKGGVSQNALQQTQYGSLIGTGTELGGSFVLFLKGAGDNLNQMVKEKNERISLLKQAEDGMKAR